jgi:hypothetical protein
VNAVELELWQWHYLQVLKKTESQEEAIKQCANTTKKPAESVKADLMIWIPIAMRLGLVYFK